jgi:hypothetical protein
VASPNLTRADVFFDHLGSAIRIAIGLLFVIGIGAYYFFKDSARPYSALTSTTNEDSRPESPALPAGARRATAGSNYPGIQGALVCPDLQTTEMLVHMFSRSLDDSVAEQVFGPNSRLVTRPAQKPDPADYGCRIIAAGTRVLVQFKLGVPVVTAALDGKKITGVTEPWMLKLDKP